jgi:hypothetical protein
MTKRFSSISLTVSVATLAFAAALDAAADTPKLGSTATDQVYIPIPPCRIVDTRIAGGPIAAGTTRNYVFYANSPNFDWSSQGGQSGTAVAVCPATFNPGGTVAPSAAVITVTVVTPSVAGNWIIWDGANPKPTISALNWNAGDIKANTTFVPGGGRTGSGPGGAVQDFAVAYNGASGTAHFVADVVGYLVENAATALECYESSATALGLAPGQIAAVFAPVCGAGWTLVGGGCDTSHVPADKFVWLKAEYYSGSFPQAQWTCIYHNSSSNNAITAYASSRCCRVPGRAF